MPVISQGTIRVNGILVGSNGPYRTQREILNALGIHVLDHRRGAYPLSENVVVWFPNCCARHNAPFTNTIDDTGIRIVETCNSNNTHVASIGVGAMLDNAQRITFAKQDPTGLYYYVGIFELDQTVDIFQKVYRKTRGSFDLTVSI